MIQSAESRIKNSFRFLKEAENKDKKIMRSD